MDHRYQEWLQLRENSLDSHGDKLCYCGHTFKCSCSDPCSELFQESIANKTIILHDMNNGWRNEYTTPDVYSAIYELCRIKPLKGETIPSRVRWLITKVESLGIPYELDIFTQFNRDYYNLILRGSSGRWVSAHHDIVNPLSDNANDNSASIINALALKIIVPSVNIIFLDGEEVGGIGSTYFSQQIKSGKLKVEWILNLELTGKGGSYFFIGNYPGNLQSHIIKIFNPPVINTPFNDSSIFCRFGIDSCVINSLPRYPTATETELSPTIELDYSYLRNCHSITDSLSTIDIDDMKVFTEQVLVPLVTHYDPR